MHPSSQPVTFGQDDIDDDIQDEQELQSPENSQHVEVLSLEALSKLSRNEALEDIADSNSRDVALLTDREYMR